MIEISTEQPEWKHSLMVLPDELDICKQCVMHPSTSRQIENEKVVFTVWSVINSTSTQIFMNKLLVRL